MSSPVEKNSDCRGWTRRRTQRLGIINSSCLPEPVPALLPEPLPAPVMTNSSSTAVSEEFSGITTEEQEFELANCLVLLSRGGNLIDQAAAEQSSGTPTSLPPSVQTEKASTEIEAERHDQIVPSCQAVESTAQTNGSDYTCKTCNKRFNTFQALGGHRASHKKPKLDSDEPKVQSSSDTGTTSSGIILKLGDINNIKDEIQVNLPVAKPPVVHTTDNNARVHQCQLCVAKFNSGQALGGHMRKHKPLNGGGDGSKNKKEKIAKASDGLDRIAIQQPSNSGHDSIVIQQQQNGGLDGLAIQQQLPNNGLDGIEIQQQPPQNGDLIRIGIQQEPNVGLELDLNLPAQPDQQDAVPQPPAVYQYDGSSPTTRLLLGSSA